MTALWKPRRLATHSAVEIWNALVAACGKPVPLSIKNGSAVIEPSAAPDGLRLVAKIDVGGNGALIAFRSFPFQELFGAEIVVNDLLQLPDGIRDVLVEGMVETCWNLVPQNRLGAYAIASIGDYEWLGVGATDYSWLAITIRGLSSQPIQAVVGCRPADLANLLDGGAFAENAPLAAVRENLRLDAFFVLGRVAARLQEIRKLAPGAVLVIPLRQSSDKFIRVNNVVHIFRSENGQVVYYDKLTKAEPHKPGCVEGAQDMEQDMAQELEQGVAQDMSQDMAQDTKNVALSGRSGGLPAFEDLQLEIDVELGSTRLTLAQIESWKPGAIVDLAFPETRDGVEVTLRCNGQGLASGDLISIDDRLAVRVNRLLIAT